MGEALFNILYAHFFSTYGLQLGRVPPPNLLRCAPEGHGARGAGRAISPHRQKKKKLVVMQAILLKSRSPLKVGSFKVGPP